MTLIKICGITNVEDATSAVRYGADALGFIFAESPRRVEPTQAKAIIEKVKSGNLLTVGVFVNEDPERIKEIAGYCGLNTLQLHGDESPEYCSGLGGFRIIKALRMKDESVARVIPSYGDIFAFLLDTYSSDARGGTGKSFDWNLAIEAKSFGRPILLSGGIGLQNVEEAVRTVRPYGVDISSSIEQAPGRKDTNKMEELIGLIKRLDSKI
jgi:phosphoribosylanthranilate isomerase